MSVSQPLIIRELGRQPYVPVWEAMKRFTDRRTEATTDELWLLEHDPVFTQGQAGKAEHVLAPGDIPVVKVDRGGQVTYHGPGQLTAYLLFRLPRLKLGARDLVSLIEAAIVETASHWGIKAYPKPDAPGVYVDERKVASLGLRIRRGCSFHGLALNVDMDLEPFRRINPCGYAGMEMTQLADLAEGVTFDAVTRRLTEALIRRTGHDPVTYERGLPHE
ncbi:MAG: lipoyl(octanoyl) transferase LipB [Gammaproteobacteria bacterium]|nr:MAG: lipoyl(octanoyl) transferase LipB [Gammaproteobacteria bacterium]